MVSGSGLLAVSGRPKARAAPSRGAKPNITVDTAELLSPSRFIMGAKTPPIRANMEDTPIPVCLWGAKNIDLI